MEDGDGVVKKQGRDRVAESSQWLDSESTCSAGSAFPAHCMCNVEKDVRAVQTSGGLCA